MTVLDDAHRGHPDGCALVADRRSTIRPKIEAGGRFCVNVLAGYQIDVCRAISSKSEDRFDGIAHRPSGAGLPVIEGVVAWTDCDLSAVHEAGDHYIAIGQVHSLAVEHRVNPLIFFQGGDNSFAPL